jgi:hypothetical protein
VSLADRRLDVLADPGTTAPQVVGAPSGWEPGVRYEPDGSRTVTLPPSPALADEASWAAAIAALGVDIPDGYRCRLVEAKYDPAAWTRETPYSVHPATSVQHKTPAVTRPVWRYRFVVEVAPARIDVDELLRAIKPRKRQNHNETVAVLPTYVYAFGDTQWGKPDGDGPDGTVARWYDSLDRAVTRYKALRKRGQCGPVTLLVAGDCIEGTQSQGGRLVGRLSLTLTEQVRLYRRTLADAVSAFAALDAVHVAVVPGNHDEALRVGDKMATRYDDSWAIEGASQVADVMAAKGYDVALREGDGPRRHRHLRRRGLRPLPPPADRADGQDDPHAGRQPRRRVDVVRASRRPVRPARRADVPHRRRPLVGAGGRVMSDDLIATRQQHYGDPRPNHERIAGLWSAYIGQTLTAHDVAMMMVLLKVARAKVDAHHEDNYDDAAAYLSIARRVR